MESLLTLDRVARKAFFKDVFSHVARLNKNWKFIKSKEAYYLRHSHFNVMLQLDFRCSHQTHGNKYTAQVGWESNNKSFLYGWICGFTFHENERPINIAKRMLRQFLTENKLQEVMRFSSLYADINELESLPI